MVEVSTSLLMVERNKMVDTIYDLETAKVNYFHIDVMDGKFVEKDTNKQMIEICEYIKNISNVRLDVHLMVEDIKAYVKSYSVFLPSIIYFHIEACKDKEEVMDVIKTITKGYSRVGIAVKPDTKIEDIYQFLPYIHSVLVMTVEPGKGGQKLISSTINKINTLRKYVDENLIDIDIEADGGINNTNVKEIKDAGANVLVTGSYMLNSNDYVETVKMLKNI